MGEVNENASVKSARKVTEMSESTMKPPRISGNSHQHTDTEITKMKSPGNVHTFIDSPVKIKVEEAEPIPETADDDLHSKLEKDKHNSEQFIQKNGWTHYSTEIISLSISEFYDEFLAENAKFSFQKWGELSKHTNFQIQQPWKKGVMVIHCVVPVTGAPFINSTRCIKTCTIVTRTDDTLVIEYNTKTLDAPYSDTFSCREVWIVLSGNPNEQKCIVEKKYNIDFVKSTIFKSKIEDRASKGIIESNQFWSDHAKKNGHFDKKKTKAGQKQAVSRIASANLIIGTNLGQTTEIL